MDARLADAPDGNSKPLLSPPIDATRWAPPYSEPLTKSAIARWFGIGRHAVDQLLGTIPGVIAIGHGRGQRFRIPVAWMPPAYLRDTGFPQVWPSLVEFAKSPAAGIGSSRKAG
jgi:hypothetical protein